MLDQVQPGKGLVVFGEEDLVMGFKVLGFSIYPVKSVEEFGNALEEAVAKRFAICLVQNKFYREAEGQINKYKNLTLPVFIPFCDGSRTDLLDGIIKGMRLRATGKY